MRYIDGTMPKYQFCEENNFASKGIRWISSIRRSRENVGRFGAEGVKCLIAGFIALGVDDPELVKEEVSDMLGYSADEIVASQLAAAMVQDGQPGLWTQRADGSLALS